MRPFARLACVVGCAMALHGCAGQRAPELAPIPKAVQKQTAAWPTTLSWKASGKLSIQRNDHRESHRIHLIANGGSSLRVVLVDDQETVIDDMVLTSKDRSLTLQQQRGLLAQFARIFRHAYLVMDEGKSQVMNGLVQRPGLGDNSKRIYGGDPLALRQVHGSWGWSALSDFQVQRDIIMPFHLTAVIGSQRLDLSLEEWALTAAPEQK